MAVEWGESILLRFRGVDVEWAELVEVLLHVSHSLQRVPSELCQTFKGHLYRTRRRDSQGGPIVSTIRQETSESGIQSQVSSVEFAL
jgi:hypothetical protein